MIRSARLQRHLASVSPDENKSVFMNSSRYSSASRLLENARFIEQGHLDSLIKTTMKSLEKIIQKEWTTKANLINQIQSSKLTINEPKII